MIVFFSSRRRHTRCALVTGVQTCALPIYARSDKINFPSAPRKRTFDNVRFRLLANDSRAVTHDSGLARPKAHARTFVADLPNLNDARSEERRVGKECVSTCRSSGSPGLDKKTTYMSKPR